MAGRISRKRILGGARDGRNVGEVKTQVGGAVGRFPRRAEPGRSAAVAEGLGRVHRASVP